METYDSTAQWAEMMAINTAADLMPPFHAVESDECPSLFPWKDDMRLTAEQKQMLQDWADAGAPEGDPETAWEVPEPPSLDLEDPDQTIEVPAAVEIDGDDDQYICFSVDPEIEGDLNFLEALQVNPGNSAIVHHVLVFLDESGASAEFGEDGVYDCFGGPGVQGTLLGAWAPGMTPNTVPPDTGMYVPGGSRFVLQVHYHPTGEGAEIDDSTSIDLAWYEGPPTNVAFLQLIGNLNPLSPPFMIPAGESDHVEEMIYTIPADFEAKLFGVGNHMHYVGVDMFVAHKYGEGADDDQCLLHTPRWDFNWQRVYHYDAAFEDLPTLHPGDQLYLRCTYDNTMDNPFVAEALDAQDLDEPQDVYLGESTLDEMCLGVFGVALPVSDFL
jgi:hypothetical protein